MTFVHPTVGRSRFWRRVVTLSLLVVLPCGAGFAAEPFPFDQELLLDAVPMGSVKRMPILLVEPNGNATLDLWCKTVPARVEVSGTDIKVETGPLPEDLPAMMSAVQCTPERMQADEGLLAAFSQVTAWRRDGEGVVLEGPRPLRLRFSDH